jgi:membrane associated rhomboid family serine protease
MRLGEEQRGRESQRASPHAGRHRGNRGRGRTGISEHDAGRWRWLALYLGSGLVGQAFGYAWDPRGAGSSVAVLGLFAWIWYATWRQHTDLRIKLIGVCGLAALAAVAAADVVADPIWVSAVVAVAVGGAGVNVVRRLPASAAGLLFGWLGVLLGVALTVLHDNHGPAVLAGLLVAGLLDRRRLPLVSAQLDN